MAKGKNHGSKRQTLHNKYKIQKKVRPLAQGNAHKREWPGP
jgi:hypothetical protein